MGGGECFHKWLLGNEKKKPLPEEAASEFFFRKTLYLDKWRRQVQQEMERRWRFMGVLTE
jgi:hypothetical protein